MLHQESYKEVTVADFYSKLKEKPVKTLDAFERICEGHLRWFSTAKQPIKTIPIWYKEKSLKIITSRPRRTSAQKTLERQNGVWKNYRSGWDWMSRKNSICTEAERLSTFFVDYCKLNDPARWDVYPTSHMDIWVSLLAKASVLSALEVNSVVWKTDIINKDAVKKTPTWHNGLQGFKRIAVVLQNALSAFSRTMDATHSAASWECALSYLSNISITSCSEAERTDNKTRADVFKWSSRSPRVL